MNLSRRYNTNRIRRTINFVEIYIFLTFLLIFSNTFARYTAKIEGNPRTETATWKIQVNNSEISEGEVLTNSIKLVPDVSTQTTTNNKLAPGQNGYFDIVINPQGTEVAVQYEINIDTTSLPKGINLTKYTIQEDNVEENISNNKITGEIDLNELQQLKESDSKTIRIYWEWNKSGTEIPVGEEVYQIIAEVNLKQKLN